MSKRIVPNSTAPQGDGECALLGTRGVADNVNIKEVRILSNRWGELREYVFEYLRRDGTSQMLHREVYDRGDSAAVLLVCRSRRTIVMTKQLRVPILASGHGNGLVIEAPAGLLEDRRPDDAIRSEAAEETGFEIKSLTKLLEVFPNPSVTTETVHLFMGEYEPHARRFPGGGLASEGEEIEITEYSILEVARMIEDGTIKDSKTIILFLFATVHGLI
jgi:GDP-mannose pyrophosphatase NudK